MPFAPRLRSAILLALAAVLTVTARASDTPAPTAVTLAGSLQSELGCSDDWQPACAATHLAFDQDDQVWQGTFNVPAGSWEYKAPLNDSWTENYGLHAQRDGANIPLALGTARPVKFYYSHETHWITDNVSTVIAVAPGSFQSELGCPGDWQPDCLRSWLQDPDGDGIYTFRTRAIPPGDYEVKVALNESWDLNYGAGGVQNGANIPFTVTTDCAETVFSYDSATHVLTVASGGGATPQPASVTIPGSFQSEVGCSGDWQADCANTHLAFDEADQVWQGTFNLPAGAWEYKAALNDSWAENYGANATPNGANLALNLPASAAVKFYYSHATHWVADNKSKVIAVAPGSFQHLLGCPGDWQPDCLRSWLQDPDGDGFYTFRTSALPAGNYEAKVAINESWDENYGAGGVPGGANIAFTVPAGCAEVVFTYEAATHRLTIGAEGAPKGNLSRAQAHWISRDTVAWNVRPDWNVRLHYASDGLTLGTDGVTGGSEIPLTYDPAGLSADQKKAFPHLAGYAAFHLPADRLPEVPAALKDQLAVSARDAANTPMDATGVQIPGVLDDTYANDARLGVSFASGAPTLRVWAPTARSVKLHLFATSSPAATDSVLPMNVDPATGVWSVTGTPAWNGQFYLYEVEVWTRATMKVEHNMVTDPYSVSLSRNSARSQIVDLSASNLKPAGWDRLVKPPLAAPEDITLYELHVRDFSATDETVPEPLRGTFRAFALESDGTRHLRALARAGLTHVHLLPSFDIATVDEDRSTWQQPGDLSSFPPDSDQQQAAVTAVASKDPFNWGYDPWHYTVPEGSYAVHNDGSARTLEFREMVQGLSRLGLRTVMDVVYNHTTASGQSDKSVLDRVVPGYYYRLDADGNVEKNSCCDDTASEHRMMEKLLVDSVVTWAKQYKVDGFRFDIMGFHMKSNILKLRAALDALTPETDGVDGRRVYLYGEGWNFGDVANNARGVNATQANMAGTGVGTFNDRLRDGARGGGPFSGIQEQGFLTGLFYDPNATDQGASDAQKARLLQEMDWIRVGLAGGLADYTFVDRFGHTVAGKDVDYNGQRAGYTADPQETINYVEAHDNDTLFDTIAVKAPVGTSIEDRVRMQDLGMSLLGFSQGIPFFHAGVDLLRSKSGDRNSYNSGDWFNRLDFTMETNNWGVGLPPAGDNKANWPILAPLLGNPALAPSRGDIHDAAAHFREVLAIRKSSPLMRLRSATDVQQRMRFLNTGPDQVPGVLAWTVADADGSVDRGHALLAVVVNATTDEKTIVSSSLAHHQLALHPLQAHSADRVVRKAAFKSATGSFVVPARTAAVFVEDRPPADQVALLAGDVQALIDSGALSGGQGRGLLAKLSTAERHLRLGASHAAAGELRAFLQQIEAFERSRILTDAQADPLEMEARAILDLIEDDRH